MTQRTFLITYGYVPEMAERRTPHRPAHLAHAQRAHEEGKLSFAAATTDPIDGAILVYSAESEGDVHAWIAVDPYVKGGLVRSVTVRELAVAIGGR
ncbi:MAG: hypothetical protein KGN00_06315 [Chloroflexota bacterium]|nr:hypothetical protein [Chloroflexota bacterium]